MKQSRYQFIAKLLLSGGYKSGRFVSPVKIAKPSRGMSLLSIPQRLREMRKLGYLESELGKSGLVEFSLTKKGIEFANKK